MFNVFIRSVDILNLIWWMKYIYQVYGCRSHEWKIIDLNEKWQTRKFAWKWVVFGEKGKGKTNPPGKESFTSTQRL